MGMSPLCICKSYMIYYGKNSLKDIKGYDIVILEPSALEQGDMAMVKSENRYIFAYLSMMEVDGSSALFKRLHKGDFLSRGDEIIRNEEYNTFLVDLGSENWTGMLKTRISSLSGEGYDGLFLDTLGDIVYFDIGEMARNRLILKAVDFLSGIRRQYPGMMLIQNNGVEISAYTSDHIDALCWENPPLSGDRLTSWSRGMFKYLGMIEKKKGIRIMVLVEGAGTVAIKKRCMKYGFMYCGAPKGYLGINLSN